jgi:TBC1 domain family member 7
MEDTRNFRSNYYDKVGFRSVEEKKSLEILLKENPLNLPKLKQFLKLFPVPSIHRSLLYNLALNVYPIYMESKEW